MQITLDPRTAELAQQAVEDGLSDSVEAIVSRAVELALGADEELPRWDPDYAADVNRKVEEGLADVAAGRTVTSEEMFPRLRKLLRDRHPEAFPE